MYCGSFCDPSMQRCAPNIEQAECASGYFIRVSTSAARPRCALGARKYAVRHTAMRWTFWITCHRIKKNCVCFGARLNISPFFLAQEKPPLKQSWPIPKLHIWVLCYLAQRPELERFLSGRQWWVVEVPWGASSCLRYVSNCLTELQQLDSASE